MANLIYYILLKTFPFIKVICESSKQMQENVVGIHLKVENRLNSDCCPCFKVLLWEDSGVPIVADANIRYNSVSTSSAQGYRNKDPMFLKVLTFESAVARSILMSIQCQSNGESPSRVSMSKAVQPFLATTWTLAPAPSRYLATAFFLQVITSKCLNLQWKRIAMLIWTFFDTKI